MQKILSIYACMNQNKEHRQFTMKLYDEFKNKKAGDRVSMWADKGTITQVISDGFHPSGNTMVAYWVKWDDYAPTCVSFDQQGNWKR